MQKRRSRVIGVLAPYTGGFYYGAAMAGIQRAATARGAAVVAIQSTGLELLWPDEPGEQFLALEAVDAWLAVNEFESPAFTQQIRARGTPLLYVNARPADDDGCSVLPDNYGGMLAAVRHLIEHGHRRIAFAGFLGQFDLRERYDAYVAAHREAGLDVDPALLFRSRANLEIGGIELGKLLLEAGLPCTAVVAGTDRVALGIMKSLRQAGVAVPKDIALVGFDDFERAQEADPPLTTVRQSFSLVAATATHTLLDHLESGAPLPATVRVPTAFVVRRSCGCSQSFARPPIAPGAPDPRTDRELGAALVEVAARGRTGEGSAAWPSARRLAELLGGIARGETSLEEHDPSALWREFLEGNRDASSVEEVLSVLESHVLAWQTDVATRETLESALRQLRLTLIRNWRRLELERNHYYELSAEANSKINHALAVWRPKDGISLSWLRWTRAQYACLGLWSLPTANEGRRLSIVAEYAAHDSQKPLSGTTHAPAQFPPESIAELARTLGEGNVLTIVPLVSSRHNRGLLAVAAPIEVELVDRAGSIGDWGAQVGAALERADAEQQLRKNAFYDALTGLPNRALLLERLEQLADDHGSAELAVFALDLDDFKNINDSKGHEAGDQLLIHVAERLERAVGADGLVSRLGGDEFGILVPTVEHPRDVLEQVNRLQEALRAPFLLEGDAVFTSCSIGVALRGQEEASAAGLLRAADTALYRAKLRGRGRYEVFEDGMHTQAVERLRLDSRLRQALENDEFTLAFQPIVSLESGEPIGAEALIRWLHPEQGLLAPARFLAVAEDVGLGIPLGQWVIETACRNARTWQRGDGSHVYVNVNVSAEHLQSLGFVDFIERTLVETGLSPQALGIELVESSLADRRDVTTRVLSRLLDLGVRVAIDDFGTGYSSLSYLKDFPVTSLKIDRSFVLNLPGDRRDTAIANAIVTMGRGLGLNVIAEGVETAEQLAALEALGCDAVQGYFLSRPLELPDCRDFFRQSPPLLARRPGAAALGGHGLRRIS